MLSTVGRKRMIYSMDIVDSNLHLPNTAIWICLYSKLDLPIQHQQQEFGMHFCCHSVISCAPLLFGCRHPTAAG